MISNDEGGIVPVNIIQLKGKARKEQASQNIVCPVQNQSYKAARGPYLPQAFIVIVQDREQQPIPKSSQTGYNVLA